MAKKSQLGQPKDSAHIVEKLLSEAKAEIASAEQVLATADESATQHYRAAADRIAEARKQNASQRKIAKDIGKSPAWVNQLLRWRKDGYHDSPFGPQSSAARLRRKERSGATEHDQSAEKNVQGDGERARAKDTKDKMAEAKAEARKAKAEAEKARADAEKWKKKAKAAAAQGPASVPNFEPEDRDRLVKLLGMLGSDQDGECVNAAHKAEKLRKKIGLTWDDLIVPAQVQYARAA